MCVAFFVGRAMLQRMMNVRNAKPQDFDSVDGLLRRVYPKLLKEDYAPSIRVLVLPRISRAQPRLLASGTYYVVELEDQIVGAGGWTRDRARQGVGHIRHVVTSDRHLRRGVASQLMRHIFGAARRGGISQMICWSTFTAEPFYAAMGFARKGVIEVPLDAGITFPAVAMERML